MKNFIINTNNLNPHFIGSWTIEPLSICDEIINYFELNLAKQRNGRTIDGVNTNFKDSIDIRITPKEIVHPSNEMFRTYFEKLFECYKQYIEEWPFLKDLAQGLEIGSFNLQRYLPGQHFKKIHTERSSIESSHRVFAFMTYLNNIEKGGSTYFSHYDLEIQPKKGLTLIWPAEWTHAHRGNILKSGTKYIITGWIHFAK
ncbi:2OG-Fe(II) oxygenase [Prochlorococcus sp. MIT 0916]|uniref:2OG-Fe(II) oxygenase n=1 Tax=Prochlorococcus sp. MIT 0916 TaxID=3082521 RepID=UPI0039B57E42